MYLTHSLFKCHHHFLGQFFVLTVQKIGDCPDCKLFVFTVSQSARRTISGNALIMVVIEK